MRGLALPEAAGRTPSPGLDLYIHNSWDVVLNPEDSSPSYLIRSGRPGCGSFRTDRSSGMKLSRLMPLLSGLYAMPMMLFNCPSLTGLEIQKGTC